MLSSKDKVSLDLSDQTTKGVLREFGILPYTLRAILREIEARKKRVEAF